MISKNDVSVLDRKLIKQSKVRIVKCGNIVERYDYELPYFYNFGSSRVSERETEEAIDKSRTDSIERARRKIKRLINANVFAYGYHPIFVTYTFKQNVQDIKIANRVFKSHHRRLAERVVGKRLRYLAVPEVQQRGAWHFHVIYFDLPYIAGIKAVFAESWAHGFVQVKAIKHVKNVGAYVSKYFGKQWLLARNKCEKHYYSSENLQQPEIFHTLDVLDNFGTMVKEHEQTFFSDKYGFIYYQQLKIIS